MHGSTDAPLLRATHPPAHPATADPTSVFGMASTAKAAGRQAVVTHITDAFKFAADQSGELRAWAGSAGCMLAGAGCGSLLASLQG
jgi:hypothetical protein